MEKRKANLIFNKNGNGYITTSISIPVPWARELGFSKEDREAELEFNNGKIILKKIKKI